MEPPPTSRPMEPSTGKPISSISQRQTQWLRLVGRGAAPPPIMFMPVAIRSASTATGAGGATTQARKPGWPLPVG
jgi:hypothetical protein